MIDKSLDETPAFHQRRESIHTAGYAIQLGESRHHFHALDLEISLYVELTKT